MDKITLKQILLLRPALLTFVVFVISSCSSIEMVSIKNSTDEAIQFRGQFLTKSNLVDNLDFTLKPGDSNLWRYEIGYMKQKSLDKGLKKIILKNEQGCKIELERSMIEKIAIKNGMWEINIDNNIMNCN